MRDRTHAKIEDSAKAMSSQADEQPVVLILFFRSHNRQGSCDQ